MSGIFRFADFELDGRSCELRKRGRRLRVQQQPLQILTMLVAVPGDIVTRDELRERIWGADTSVFQSATQRTFCSSLGCADYSRP